MDRSNLTKLLLLANIVLKPRTDNDIILEDEAIAYRQVTGSIIYLANNTWLDISYCGGAPSRWPHFGVFARSLLVCT